MNKAVPGLFPDFSYQNDEDIKRLSEAVSIDTQVFQKVVNELPIDYRGGLAEDKFYLTRFYNRKENADDTDLPVAFENFYEYDKTIRRELKLRQRLEILESVNSNGGIRLPKLDNLHALYTRGSFHQAKDLQDKKKSVFNLFHRRNQGSVDNEGSSYEISNMRLDAGSSNVTAIIDKDNPECDFIEYRFEKKNLVVQEVGPVSTMTADSFIEGPHHPSWSSKKLQGQVTIQRKLKVRHLQMISLGATIGVGLFLNSGKAFSIAGPLGTFLGYLFGALTILATLLSFAEIVALIPLITGISGLCSRFIGDAFGFSVGWCHWASYAFGFPSELIATAIMLSYYTNLQSISTNQGSMASAIVIMIVALTVLNLMDVRVYGELEYFASTIKLIVVALLIILMIVVNCGGLNNGYIGFRYWDKNKSTSEHITFGAFRPTFDLKDTGDGARNGIGGFGGVLLSCIASTLVAVFSYVGSEIGFIAAGEAQNPRKAVPSVTKRIFTRVVVFYLLSIFVVGLNFYSGDPRLLRYYSPEDNQMLIEKFEGYKDLIDSLGGLNCNTVLTEQNFVNESSNQSPWVIALKSFKQCTLSSIVNGVFVAIGFSAASSQLYASSRTLYSMATQQKAPSVFTWCNRHGVPYMSVIFCAFLGFLSLLCLNMKSTDVFIMFINIGAMGSVIMWFSMNLSFLRFYYALKRRPDIISRDSKEYPYKSPLQPYLSIFGMVSTAILVLFNGFQNFFYWNTKNFISSYCTVVLFVVLYFGYNWFKHSQINKLENIDLDSGRREMDSVIWKEDVDYSLSLKEFLYKILSYI